MFKELSTVSSSVPDTSPPITGAPRGDVMLDDLSDLSFYMVNCIDSFYCLLKNIHFQTSSLNNKIIKALDKKKDENCTNYKRITHS